MQARLEVDEKVHCYDYRSKRRLFMARRNWGVGEEVAPFVIDWQYSNATISKRRCIAECAE
jgi:hypothetical protein